MGLRNSRLGQEGRNTTTRKGRGITVGDRANFGFVQPNGETIVLYGHWAGYHMLANLAEAVAKAQPRWSDPSYATRIAISNLIGDGWSMETGWGLHVNEIGDNEHKIAIVDFTQMTFSLHEEDSLRAFVEKYTDAPILV